MELPSIGAVAGGSNVRFPPGTCHLSVVTHCLKPAVRSALKFVQRGLVNYNIVTEIIGRTKLPKWNALFGSGHDQTRSIWLDSELCSCASHEELRDFLVQQLGG